MRGWLGNPRTQYVLRGACLQSFFSGWVAQAPTWETHEDRMDFPAMPEGSGGIRRVHIDDAKTCGCSKSLTPLLVVSWTLGCRCSNPEITLRELNIVFWKATMFDDFSINTSIYGGATLAYSVSLDVNDYEFWMIVGVDPSPIKQQTINTEALPTPSKTLGYTIADELIFILSSGTVFYPGLQISLSCIRSKQLDTANEKGKGMKSPQPSRFCSPPPCFLRPAPWCSVRSRLSGA